MNINKKLLIPLLIAFGLISAVVYFSRGGTNQSPTPSPYVSQELKTTLSFEEKSFDASAFIGKSALEVTKEFLKVKETGSGENAFITTIEGISADSKKHEFWELIINGQSANVGAGSYTVQKGDTILWKLSNY